MYRPSAFVRGNAGEDMVRGVPSEVSTYRQIAVQGKCGNPRVLRRQMEPSNQTDIANRMWSNVRVLVAAGPIYKVRRNVQNLYFGPTLA